MFKVVPDQLRVSDGWVRCGQCNEVFDANDNLESAAPTAPVNANPRGLVPGQTIVFPSTDTGDSEEPADLDSTKANGSDDRAWSNDPAPSLNVDPHALHIEPADITLRTHEPSLHWEATSEVVVATMDSTNEEDAALAVASGPRHSFMEKGAAESTIWTSRAMHITLALLSVVLIVVLALQVVVFERDRISASLPQTTPALQTLCSALSCTLSPLRQIESVIIDSSAFTRIRGDVYRLSFTLKNTAQIRLATPGMELTLTDTEDRAVARRVFLPEVFAGPSGIVEAGAEFQASLPVNVKLSGNHEKISGYRLLSFYP